MQSWKWLIYTVSRKDHINSQCGPFHYEFNCSSDWHQLRGWFTNQVWHRLFNPHSYFQLVMYMETWMHTRQSIISSFKQHIFGNLNFWNKSLEVLHPIKKTSKKKKKNPTQQLPGSKAHGVYYQIFNIFNPSSYKL
jgi:hypothetical protein